MKTLAVFNIKGGVGKTATAINLAYLAARDGHPTLLWDLDPQGATSFTLRTRTRVRGGGRKVLEGRKSLDDLIRGSDFEHLDVVPADLSNRKMETTIQAAPKPERAFLEALKPAQEEYDLIVLDCAPTLSGLSECIFTVADVLLCPVIPTPLSLRTLAQLMKYLKRREGRRPRVLPFFCMVDRRKALHRRTCDWVAEQGLGFLDATIPYSSIVEQMSARRTPLFTYAGRTRPARAYEELWNEILARATKRRNGQIYARSTRKALEEAARNGEGTPSARRASVTQPPATR